MMAPAFQQWLRSWLLDWHQDTDTSLEHPRSTELEKVPSHLFQTWSLLQLYQLDQKLLLLYQRLQLQLQSNLLLRVMMGAQPSHDTSYTPTMEIKTRITSRLFCPTTVRIFNGPFYNQLRHDSLLVQSTDSEHLHSIQLEKVIKATQYWLRWRIDQRSL